MEREALDYKIVMDDGPDTEVLGRLASLDIASAAYLQALVKYPQRNVQLRQGEHTIKRHDGEPKPESPKLKLGACQARHPADDTHPRRRAPRPH
jgi:hypothetical protein